MGWEWGRKRRETQQENNTLEMGTSNGEESQPWDSWLGRVNRKSLNREPQLGSDTPVYFMPCVRCSLRERLILLGPTYLS